LVREANTLPLPTDGAVTVLETVRARRERWRQRSELRQLLPLIPDVAPRALGELAPDYMTERAQLTSTGVAVVVLAAHDGSDRVVVKMPMTAEALVALDAETRILAHLHADQRFADWRRLLPRPRGSGSLHGRRFRVDSALPGRSAGETLADAAAAEDRVDAAAEIIHELHRVTGVSVTADDALVERWIDDPVRMLMTGAGYLPGAVDQLQRVQGELHDAVEGRAFWATAIHGDYWLGNVLFAGSQPSGVVDWDSGGTAELPAVDVLHLLVYTRCLVTGQELGEVVSEQLADPDWSAHERRLLATYGRMGADGSLPERPALLLYWLRHVARRTRQTSDHRGIGDRLWERRNVRRVLEAV
jgi:aminoglycoside phosphotransferase (APT) family kinase protein